MNGIILAGGRSSRMGSDKALLSVGGMPLLRLLAERMRPVCPRIWIACGDAERAAVYREVLKQPAQADAETGQGGVAGPGQDGSERELARRAAGGERGVTAAAAGGVCGGTAAEPHDSERVDAAGGRSEWGSACVRARDSGREAGGDAWLRYVADGYPGCGPLAGLHAALTAAPDGWALAMACDMPQLSLPLLRRMLAAAEAAEAAGRQPGVVHAPGQPLHALYHTRAAGVVREQLERGDYRFMRLLDRLGGVVVEPSADEAEAAFRNLNTPDAFRRFANEQGRGRL